MIHKNAEIFCRKKNVSSFCTAKATQFFSAKITEYCMLGADIAERPKGVLVDHSKRTFGMTVLF